MLKACSFALLFVVSCGSAWAGDLSPICAGYVGKWHIVIDSNMKEDRSWTLDQGETDGNWHVDAIAPGKCRFFTSKGANDFDVDTTHGSYDVTDYLDGKAQSPETYAVISYAAEGPRAWMLTTATPHHATSNQYSRMIITVAGDLLTVEIATADRPDGDFVPREISVHKRVP